MSPEFDSHVTKHMTSTGNKCDHLFGSNLELSSAGTRNLLKENSKIQNQLFTSLNTQTNRSPSISARRDQTGNKNTPDNHKSAASNNFKVTCTSGGEVVTGSKASFVNKHLLIQRRKTIHDIINFDLLTSLINSNSTFTCKTENSNKTINSKSLNATQAKKNCRRCRT